MTTKVPRMSTKTLVKKFEEKGYTVEDLNGNWKIHEEGGMEYKDWIRMMKCVVDEMPPKEEMERAIALI